MFHVLETFLIVFSYLLRILFTVSAFSESSRLIFSSLSSDSTWLVPQSKKHVATTVVSNPAIIVQGLFYVSVQGPAA